MTSSCSNTICAKAVARGKKFVSLFLDNQFSRLVSKYGGDVTIHIADPTGIIPYSGKYSLSDLTISNYVRFLSPTRFMVLSIVLRVIVKDCNRGQGKSTKQAYPGRAFLPDTIPTNLLFHSGLRL